MTIVDGLTVRSLTRRRSQERVGSTRPGLTGSEIKKNKKQLNCILLIDDDEPTNFLNKMTLEQAGCTRHIRIAQSGQAALEYLRGVPVDDYPRPDLIFLDINM